MLSTEEVLFIQFFLFRTQLVSQVVVAVYSDSKLAHVARWKLELLKGMPNSSQNTTEDVKIKTFYSPLKDG